MLNLLWTMFDWALVCLGLVLYVIVGGVVSGALRRMGASEEVYILTGLFWPLGLPLLGLTAIGNKAHVIAATFPEHETRQVRQLESSIRSNERLLELNKQLEDQLGKMENVKAKYQDEIERMS